MADYKLHRESFVPRPLDEVFDFFSKPENLEKITPPWLNFRILTGSGAAIDAGVTIAYQLRVHGIPLKWLTEIERWNPPFEFIDVQLRGPYKLWRHAHRFMAVNGGTRIEDTVEYTLPFGWMGRLVHKMQVARDIENIFDYREQRVRELLHGN